MIPSMPIYYWGIRRTSATNNPLKISSLEDAGIKVNDRVELDNFVNPENSQYLLTKAQRMNHLLRTANTPTDS